MAHSSGAIRPALAVGVASHRRSKMSLRLVRSIPFFLFLAAVSTLAGFLIGRLNNYCANWPNSSAGPSASSLPSAPAKLSASDAQPKSSDVEELTRLAPQQQAERLLELAIHRPDPSLDLIRRNLDSWRGRLESNDHLFHLVLAALEADDPRVRTAAVEIDLAANHLEKSSQSLT